MLDGRLGRDYARRMTRHVVIPTTAALAIGLAAGIILDATLIRALLVPALMRLFGDANWWMPNWTRIALRLPVVPEPSPPVATETP